MYLNKRNRGEEKITRLVGLFVDIVLFLYLHPGGGVGSFLDSPIF